ncbi:maleylpyruvate isomerase family mycothiol-dependent enzyme [Actinoplanes sp. NPDC026619]|uniref:maleylpyruvate isomerase family mycothiol-dependent enzyme n=1 Tax=Actinoplanes sp. NPDC026619 TaxID=3155798 RepID=UPI0033CFBAC2
MAIDDLEAEQDELEALLAALTPAQWRSPSAAEGWTVADTVLHLAQTEERVPVALSEAEPALGWEQFGDTIDDAMAAMVRAQPAEPAQTFARWRAARRASVAALRAADPGRAVFWAVAPLKPRTLATTRLAEHWAHGLDITGPLGIDRPDTARLRHIAWLAHSTLPWVMEAAVPVFCDLAGPGGESWPLGDPAAESVISGSAGAFCRVGAQRLTPAASGLKTSGPYAEKALAVLRTYA